MFSSAKDCGHKTIGPWQKEGKVSSMSVIWKEEEDGIGEGGRA